MTKREQQFAKILFDSEDLDDVYTGNDAEWRQMLEAIDYAIESHEE